MILFLASALSKIRHPRYFIVVVENYKLLPNHWVRPFALTLPWVEAGIGLLLLLGWQMRIAAGLSALLMLAFVLAIGRNLARGRKDLTCGCFGPKHKGMIGWKVIGRDVLLLLLSIQTALWGGGYLALDNQPMTTQQFLLERYLLAKLFPLVLSGIGLYLLYRLFLQLDRLIRLIPWSDENDRFLVG
jgi:uncharacterized membrane protein YphA (DoxX/SURF4 family)